MTQPESSHDASDDRHHERGQERGQEQDPQYTADDKATLHASLDRMRDAVVGKLADLDDEQLRRPLTPSGTSLLGLVKHLGSVEYGWFVSTFGGEVEPLWFDPYSDEDMRADQGETTRQITDFYARARAAADRTIRERSLDDLGRPSWRGQDVSLRWVLVHMIEETARHAGHMDIVRELIDGATGDRRPGS
ncbi:DinB family protein [Streptomyces sp. NPDC058867]|uniref:DinB family protein n=1 Tax=unclassified Streptomyces TaxID=2593676 RepID=UPI0036CF9C46